MSAASRILAVAAAEATIQRRNRWILIATAILTLFALVLSVAGSAPTGTLGVDMLTVSVASMTTLAVYLVPLIGLLMSADAVAGEAERGALGLILSYPVARGEMLLGKALAHLGALALACLVGFGSAGVLAAAMGGTSPESLIALARLIATAVLLGCVFLGLGYGLSAVAGSPTAAAGLSAALWLVLVVLYDLGLLAALVLDEGGTFTQSVFPWVLTANPADAFRLWNLAGSENVAIAGGMAGAAQSLPAWAAPLSLILWPVLAFTLATRLFGKVEP